MMLWGIVIVGGAFLGMLKDLFIGIASETFGYELRERFYDVIIHKSTAFFDEKKTGDILSRLTSDSEIVQIGLSNGVQMMFKSIVTLLVIVLIIFTYNIEMSLVAIGMMAPICILAPISSRVM